MRLVRLKYLKVTFTRNGYNKISSVKVQQKSSFPIRHYKLLYDLIATVTEFLESSKKKEFITTLNGYLNKYLHSDGFTTALLNT